MSDQITSNLPRLRMFAVSRRFCIFSCGIALSLACPWWAHAEIVKEATIDCSKNQICLYWWPKLPPIKGWHTEQAANFSNGSNGINSLVPDGFTFSNADAVIYAAAIYKPRYERENPVSKTLSAFIMDDKAAFSSEHPDMSISEVAPLMTADGQNFRSFTYVLPSNKTWEQVTYGEEDDYYILFTISARSEAAYRENLPAYNDLIMRYHK